MRDQSHSLFLFFFKVLRNKLSIDEVLVHAAKSDECVMSASLFDLSVLHYYDFVRVFNGAKSVGDNDDVLIATAYELVKSLLHLVFTFSVQGRGRFVKQQQLGFADESTRDSDTLFLTS